MVFSSVQRDWATRASVPAVTSGLPYLAGRGHLCPALWFLGLQVSLRGPVLLLKAFLSQGRGRVAAVSSPLHTNSVPGEPQEGDPKERNSSVGEQGWLCVQQAVFISASDLATL